MYIIYHIPGKKIGCTSQKVKKRVKAQKFINYEVLEMHNDISIASQREIELQKQYGYKVDNTLYKIIYSKNKSPIQRQKISKALKGREITWGEKINTKERNKKISKTHMGLSKGKGISRNKGTKARLGCGVIYKELSTGFEGKSQEIMKRFNINDGLISYLVKRNKPITRGKNKGLHIICL